MRDTFRSCISVKFVGLFAVDGEEAGAGIIGSQWLEELFEGRMEAESYSRIQQRFDSHDNRMGRLYDFVSSWTITGYCDSSLVRAPPSWKVGFICIDGRMRTRSSAPDPLQYVLSQSVSGPCRPRVDR